MTKTYSSALKARNVDDEIAAHGFEKGIRKCVVMLAEYQQVIRESQVELASQLSQLADIVAQFSEVASNMHDVIQKITVKDKDVGSDDQNNHH